MGVKRQDWMPEKFDSKVENNSGPGRLNYVVYLFYNSNGNPVALAFRGSRSQKPYANYRFGSEAQREAWLKDFVEARDRDINYSNQYAAEYAEKRKEFLENLEVGSILDYSWGYEQTNWQFFEVVEIKGKDSCSLVLRELVQNADPEDSNMSNKTEPVPGEYKGEEFKKRVSKSGPWVKMDYGNASLWNGKKKTATHYA